MQRPNEPPLDVFKRVHVSTGHFGRDHVLKEIHEKYVNVATPTLELFRSLCENARNRESSTWQKGVVGRPILSNDLISRGHVSFIDMQAMVHWTFKWIKAYQDHFTKFCVLRPLTSKWAVEVSMHLVGIFLLFWCPTHTSKWQWLGVYVTRDHRTERCLAWSHYCSW